MRDVRYSYIPVRFDVLDTETNSYLEQCWLTRTAPTPRSKRWFQRDEPIKGAAVSYHLIHAGFGDLGRIELTAAGDGISNLFITSPLEAEKDKHMASDLTLSHYRNLTRDGLIDHYLKYLKDKGIWNYDMRDVFDQELPVGPDDLLQTVRDFFESRHDWLSVEFDGITQSVSLEAARSGEVIEIRMVRHNMLGHFRSFLGIVYCIPVDNMRRRVVVRVANSPDIPLKGFEEICQELGAYILRAVADNTSPTSQEQTAAGAGQGEASNERGDSSAIIRRLDEMHSDLGEKLDDIKQFQRIIYERIGSEAQSTVTSILNELREQAISQGEMERMLDAIRRALKSALQTGLPVDDPAIKQSLAEIQRDLNSNFSFKQQFELSLPVIPFLLEYKVELDAGAELGAIWEELKERVKKKRE